MRRVSRNRSRTRLRPCFAELVALVRVGEELEDPVRALLDGIDEVAADAVLELEGDASGPPGDDGRALPERFGDDEPEALADRFLDHDLGDGAGRR